ncbi:methyltransferase [Candidatus Caldarchaeum subterraneum]|uniref:Methyltransferase n=2 Tax=Thermoproteati TaxID=1783275 RepID=E6N862_CALS0|nr:methyltransferase [Candidatus Caldarchaeum subterraneum]BAJ51232.1 methyltransferase [Candidatus Caldarchaeum subterraneum]
MGGCESAVIGSPLRRLLQNPFKILAEVGLRPMHRFLDVGCGKGFLTFPAASVVGEKGMVYAVDVSEEYLEIVKSRAAALGLGNVKVLKTAGEDLEGVPNHVIDRAAYLFSLHHIGDIRKSLETLRSKLVDDGLVYILDPIGSRLLGHGTSPSHVLSILEETGYKVTGFTKGLLFWKALAKPV